MSEKRREDLEGLLDRTLRGMVAGEGPDDLRPRVMARLDTPRPRSFSPAWATAALVAAVATGWWLWRSEAPVPVPEPVREATREAPPTTPAFEASPPPAPRPAAETQTRVGRARWTPDPSTADPPIPPLPPPDLLAMASLEPADIEIEPLAFAPLVVADLALEPLAEPEHERKD